MSDYDTYMNDPVHADNGFPIIPGTISRGTMRNQDLIGPLTNALADFDPNHPLTREAISIYEDVELAGEDWESENITGFIHDLFDALSAIAGEAGFPGYFGAHEGDGSDYGFWLDEEALEAWVMMR